MWKGHIRYPQTESASFADVSAHCQCRRGPARGGYRQHGTIADLHGGGGGTKRQSSVVVTGNYDFLVNMLVDMPDPELLESRGVNVARLPGNGEFFVNSILWLAHDDSLLAISPHALEMARIEDMSPAKLAFWKIGVLTAGLPGAVLLAGLAVYLKRRD